MSLSVPDVRRLLDDFSETRSLHRYSSGNGARENSCVMSTTPSGILATLEEMQQPTQNMLQHLHAIMDRVRPSIEGLLATDMAVESAR